MPSEDQEDQTVKARDEHPGVADIPPPTAMLKQAQAQVTAGIATTALGLLAVLLGCLLLALEVLTYLGLLLLVVTIVLLLKARQNIVLFAQHPGVADIPPPN